jgi:hypothetical protein
MKLHFQASVFWFMRRGVFSFAKTMNLVSDIFGLPGPLSFLWEGHPSKAEKLPCHSYLEFGNCRLCLDGYSNKNKQFVHQCTSYAHNPNAKRNEGVQELPSWAHNSGYLVWNCRKKEREFFTGHPGPKRNNVMVPVICHGVQKLLGGT